MQTKKALIIFVKNPALGKVKTRLAKSIGDEKALAIYRLLLQHTQQITSRLNCNKFVFYHDFIPEKDEWEGYYKCKQHQSKNLGTRMRNAFQKVFEKGYKKVVIIGSDCYEMQTENIERAFETLDDASGKQAASLVIGPAFDGGYYLLGMRQFFPEIFNEVSWSTSEVLKETQQILAQKNIPYHLLKTLSDIDTEADVPEELKVKIHLLKNECYE